MPASTDAPATQSAPLAADGTPMSGVIPYINVEGASEASAFYQKAFGAKEVRRMPAEDGKRLMHCHLIIHGGSLMLADAFPEYGYPLQPSHSFTMQLVVSDVQDLVGPRRRRGMHHSAASRGGLLG
jgi:uncharacterized glyoxalase superfamily protein PhnB